MKDFFLKMLSTDSNVSLTRFLVFIVVLASIVFAFVSLLLNRDLEKAAWIVTSFLVPAFGCKAIQSKYENLTNTPSQNETPK